MSHLKMLLHVTPSTMPDERNGFSVRQFTGSDADVDLWLAICKNGLAQPEDGREKYENSMLKHEGYRVTDTYFILYDGKEVATFTVIVYDDKKTGNLHMVAAVPEIRGRGVGSYMAAIAKAMFYQRGCRRADLLTNEFRVPAVRSYLSAGFLPVLHEADMEERWNRWLTENGYHDVRAVDENGVYLKTLVPQQAATRPQK